MRAGSLDRRVEILRAVSTKNALNEAVETWPVLATRSASKQDVSDAERERAAAVGASITSRFQVRSDSVTRTITGSDRLRCEGRTYNIGAVKELGRNVGLEISATARAD